MSSCGACIPASTVRNMSVSGLWTFVNSPVVSFLKVNFFESLRGERASSPRTMYASHAPAAVLYHARAAGYPGVRGMAMAMAMHARTQLACCTAAVARYACTCAPGACAHEHFL